MKFIFGKQDLKDFERGEEKGYLLTNGLGGFSSLTAIGSNARNDHALLMAAVKAPNQRYHLLSNLYERVKLEGKEFILSSQQFVNTTKNTQGYHYLNLFSYENLPQWTYQTEGLEIIKTLVMVQNENTIGIHYRLIPHGKMTGTFCVTPLLQFALKGKQPLENQIYRIKEDAVESEGITLYYETNGRVETKETAYINDVYYPQDACDGRDAVGHIAYNQNISMELTNEEKEFYIIYSTQKNKHEIHWMMEEEIKRQEELLEKAGIQDEVGRCLVRSANQFIAERESTGGKTILAGYPFFEDWGRDTMIAFQGCALVTGQYETAKSILYTFMKYCEKGLMPNLFPEGADEPLYNTVDAALLFINAVYEYYHATKDMDFLKEAYPVMAEIIEWYRKGTDYHIKMDEDGLIMAGSGQEQVTWMDVRIQNILPTPRHGKPVEVNAYWYNSLRIMEELSTTLYKDERSYKMMADETQISFCSLFWNEEENCLKDVLSGTEADNQIRCNQIWAVSMPFCMLEKRKAQLVIDKVFEKLYTPYGLRTLAPEEKEFCATYGGCQFQRDLAYHQGTVWAFPLGAYYIAYLRYAKDAEEAKRTVRRQLEPLRASLSEGCLGQIAEIYDGLYPGKSKGCFAQAWSVAEILRVYKKLEEK
ncbi:MAG: amylo-alpha-1,6-glucosidase [Acetivibrio sp.]